MSRRNATPARFVGVKRRSLQLVAALYLATLLGSVAMVVGPWLNDRAIGDDPGRALATVSSVSSTRTTVSFQDDEGLYHSPVVGVKYPSGLGEGQRVWVEYDKDNPDLVKIAGRKWTLSIIPALSVAAVATIIASLCWGAVVRYGTKPKS